MTAIRIISLGWGIQSWTLAAMAALGEIDPVEFVIHSDTTWEKEDTYKFAEKWTSWLEDKGVKVITVVSNVARGVVKDEWSGTFIPAFTLSDTGSRGQLRRQCTGRWKIVPMRRYISLYLKERGIKKNPGIIHQMLGITTDEWHRAKDSDVKYIINKFPLLDMNMNRYNCVTWLRKNNLDVPVKSACTFCPYQSLDNWKQMKNTDGQDWEQAVWVDSKIRNERPPYPLFVHPARKILSEAVKIPKDEGADQLDMFDLECDSGYCFL